MSDNRVWMVKLLMLPALVVTLGFPALVMAAVMAGSSWQMQNENECLSV